jgi:hypothetical protein
MLFNHKTSPTTIKHPTSRKESAPLLFSDEKQRLPHETPRMVTTACPDESREVRNPYGSGGFLVSFWPVKKNTGLA